MEWLQAFMIAGSTIGACWWMHKEHSADVKEISKEFHEEMKDFHRAMKDFHGRLCMLEEKYHQMIQRIWEKK